MDKTLVVAFLFLFSVLPARAQILQQIMSSQPLALPTVVQSNGKLNTNSTTTTAVLSLGIAAGDRIIAGCGVNHTTTCTVADSLNGTFGAATVSESNTNGALGYLFVLTNSVAGASDTITCTAAASGNTACFAIDITFAPAGALDQHTGSVFTTATTTPTSPNITTTVPSEVIVALFGANNASETITAGTGYTLFTNGSQGGTVRSFGAEYQVVSATGTYNAGATFSGSSQGITAIVSIE